MIARLKGKARRNGFVLTIENTPLGFQAEVFKAGGLVGICIADTAEEAAETALAEALGIPKEQMRI